MKTKHLLLICLFFILKTSHAGPLMSICLDGDCQTKKLITLSDTNWNNVKEIFSPPAKTADQERKYISKALAMIEQKTLQTLSVRTVKGLSANDLHASMNNRDQTLNYKTFLSLLQDHKLILLHTVRKTEHRTSWTGRDEYVVVIQNRKNTRLYAIDANQTDYSMLPEIISLKKWKNKKKYSSIGILKKSKTQFKEDVR